MKEVLFEFDKLSDLGKYKIGITTGYSYGEKFDDFLKTAEKDSANSDYSNYRKLMNGRIDIFPGNEIVAKGLFRKYPELAGRFVHSDKSFVVWTLYMTVSKRSLLAGRMDEINRILADMINEGFIEKTVSGYTE